MQLVDKLRKASKMTEELREHLNSFPHSRWRMDEALDEIKETMTEMLVGSEAKLKREGL